jgi:hypothetical protein
MPGNLGACEIDAEADFIRLHKDCIFSTKERLPWLTQSHKLLLVMSQI